jgi:glycerol-3-phosphate acyltransferase PlsY
MPPFLLLILLACAAYLLGSVPFGLVAGRLRGVDLRKHGSGNVGATNVVRVLGKPTGIAVFVLDFLKGLVPTLAFPPLAATEAEVALSRDALALIFGSLAVLGHVFPVWLRGKGGKGVATSAGLCCGLEWSAMLAAFAVWYLVFKAFRYVSLASLAAAVAFPAAFIAIEGPGAAFGERRIVTIVAVLLAVGIAYTHRTNIGRLLRGEELRAGTVRSTGEKPR